MSWELGLSLILAAIALASALYARSSARSAAASAAEGKRANDIALHDRKLQVLEAVKTFQAELLFRGEDFSIAELNRMLLAMDNAKLYFPDELATAIEAFAKAGHELNIRQDHVKRREQAGHNVPPDRMQAVFDQVDHCRALAKELRAQLEAHLRLVE